MPPDSGLPPLYAPDYEPIWSVCEDLDMPINNHAGQANPEFGSYEASPAVFIIELSWYSHRVFWHMVFGNVFARHPNLKLALTEQASGWMPNVLTMLDQQFNRFKKPGTAEYRISGALAEKMGSSPSEFWARNCFAGSSFLRPSECALRYEIGVDKIMWGQDYPHTEGTYPYTLEALRNTFAGVPTDEVAAMLGGNAAGRLRLRPRRARARRRARRPGRRRGRQCRSTRCPPTPSPSPSAARTPSPGRPHPVLSSGAP